MHVVFVILMSTWQHPNMMEKSCVVILPNFMKGPIINVAICVF